MLPDALRQKPLRDWEFADLELVIGAEESIGLELKSGLQINKDAKGWQVSGKLHASERDGLAKEIVALANAYGGDLIVGMEESDDNPKRATKLSEMLNDVDALVDQLRRSLASIIDPPLTGLEIKAIKEKPEDPNGYLAIRTTDSLSKPHGHGTPSLAYVRRDDRSEPMKMREMQDRFFEAQTNRQRIQEALNDCLLTNSGIVVPMNAIGASLSLVPSRDFFMPNPIASLRDPDFLNDRPISTNGITASIANAISIHNWRPSIDGAIQERIDTPELNRYFSRWQLSHSGRINLVAYKLCRPTGVVDNHGSENLVDVEVNPMWMSVAARELISFQQCIISSESLMPMDWYFQFEFSTPNGKYWTRTDRAFGDHERLNWAGPIKCQPIVIRDYRDTEALEMIERKILSAFSLENDPFGRIIEFETA